VSLTAACGWTLCRSVLVALAALPIAWWLRSRLDSLGALRRLVLWTVLLVPFFTPTLLTGYAYSKWSLGLIRHPAWNEALYAVVLALRFIPIGTLILHFTPPGPVSAEALHCARLNAGRVRGRVRRAAGLLPYVARGAVLEAFPAFAVIFLLTFQEFETASLMGTASWTVWLFDSQAGGMLLSETLRRAVLPAGCVVVVLGLFFAHAVRSRVLPAAPRRRPGRVSAWRDAGAWALGAAACVAVTGVPLVLLGRDAARGLAALPANRFIVGEIGIAAAFGAASGTIAALVAGGLRRLSSPGGASSLRRTAAATSIAVALPGLLGSLVVSLVVLWLFQRPVLWTVYDSPAPAVVALVLFLLPRALLLQLLFATATSGQGLHTADLLAAGSDAAQRRAAGDLRWDLRVRPQFLAAGILCLWGYLELTPVAILAPPGITSAPVRLYNLMHYGRSYVVSAMTLVAMAVPPLLLLVLALVRKPLLRVR
jgi:iron(III) transport system permease protein